MEFALLLFFVFLLDSLLGDPHSRFHPVALFGRLAGKVEAFCRKRFGNGIGSGAAAWCCMVLPASLLSWCAVKFAERWDSLPAFLLAGILLYFTVALKSLLDHAEKIRAALEQDDLPGARRALSMIVSRDTEGLSASDVARGAIESLGENLTDAVTSAFFWAFLGYLADGLPGAAAGAVFLRVINTLDACWGYKNERYLLFGRMAARADDVVHYLPARLTLLVIAAVSPLTGGNPVKTLNTGFRDGASHPSPNSGYGMAAFAGALDLRLGGPTVYQGELENYPYWGTGRSILIPKDILRAEFLVRVTGILFLILLAGLYALWEIYLF